MLTGRKYCFPAQVKFSAGLASRMVSPPGQTESAEAQGTRWEAPKDMRQTCSRSTRLLNLLSCNVNRALILYSTKHTVK